MHSCLYYQIKVFRLHDPVAPEPRATMDVDCIVDYGSMAERDSQKGIIIGHQGVALKRVSTEARKSLEKFFPLIDFWLKKPSNRHLLM